MGDAWDNTLVRRVFIVLDDIGNDQVSMAMKVIDEDGNEIEEIEGASMSAAEYMGRAFSAQMLSTTRHGGTGAPIPSDWKTRKAG